jgi:photosystem II stability/assembly factor-like uncharacterized protein
VRRLLVLAALSLMFAPCARSAGLRAGDGGWVWQNPAPMANQLHAVHFVSTRTGWAIGDAGTILRTDDAGDTWTSQVSGTDGTLLFAHFLDASHGWIIGIRSGPGSPIYPILLATSDGGASWQPQDPATTDLLYCVRFTDAQHGWLAGENGTMRSTDDGGRTWQVVHTGVGARLADVFFTDRLHGWIVGGDDVGPVGSNRVFLRTVDGGATWSGAVTIPGVPLTQVQFLTTTVGWTLDQSGVLSQSADGGGTWAPVPFPGGYIGAFQFVDARNGWAEGASLWRTSDGGVTWQDTGWQTDGWRHDWQFLDALNGFSTQNGRPFRTDDSGQTWQPLFPDSVRPDFRAVSFPTARTGWVLASSLVLWHTTDAGTHWTAAPTAMPAGEAANAVRFPDPQHGWIVGSSGNILHTADGGATWQPHASGTTGDLTSLVALDAGHAWARGTDAFVRTRDGGATWESLPTGGPCDFTSADVGFRVSRNVVQRTADGGLHWADAATLDAGYTLGRIDFVDASNGIVGGSYRPDPNANRRPVVLRTSDGGATWAEQPLGAEPYEAVVALRLLSPCNAWVMASGHEYHSTDGGKSWTRRWLGSSWFLQDVDFPDPLNGWAVGAQGAILHTRTGGVPPGDVNGDNTINAADARMALQMAGGLLEATADAAARADMDGDGRVTLADAADILRHPTPPYGVVEGPLTANDYYVSPYGSHVIGVEWQPVTALVSATVDLRNYEGKNVRLTGMWLPGYPAPHGYGPPMLDVRSAYVLP